MPLPRPIRAFALLSLIASGGCSEGRGALRQARLDLGFGQRDVAAPEFVANSRRPEDGFMPVGVSAPRPVVPARGAAGLKALQDELERARIRNEARGRAADALGRSAGSAPASP